ncbi:MAG: S-adenosylmethionine:tRNA ribosyltransferase-isomerase, partial [Massilimaliae sp.]|nr:S-adenosylmethionine:tRNA ribosyltransferase-isomerase [Massiliimalia sp.]
MKTSDFYYDLPQELIAQTPVEPRDHSRLMVLDRKNGSLSHLHFYDVLHLLNPGDLLVVYNSRVLPARLYGTKEDTGVAMDLLLLEQKE